VKNSVKIETIPKFAKISTDYSRNLIIPAILRLKMADIFSADAMVVDDK
jgi:hypothetical protein